MNKTLQDRLVKELRLCAGISTMEAGNTFLPEFMADYNERFGRPAKNAHDAHRPLRSDEDLSRIFTLQEERTMSRNLVVHFKRVSYLVEPGPETLPSQAARRVFEWRTGESRSAARPTASLLAIRQERCVNQGAVVENKRLGAALSVIQASQLERDKVRLASKKLTLREKDRIEASRITAGTLEPEPPAADGLSEVASFLERFERSRKREPRRTTIETPPPQGADTGTAPSLIDEPNRW